MDRQLGDVTDDTKLSSRAIAIIVIALLIGLPLAVWLGYRFGFSLGRS